MLRIITISVLYYTEGVYCFAIENGIQIFMIVMITMIDQKSYLILKIMAISVPFRTEGAQ